MDSKAKEKRVFLHPGEFIVGDEHYRISTLLGSCVAITLWHPARKIGAMSHFLLPTQGGRGRSWPSGRYGDEVLDLMLGELAQLQIPPHECQAKLFGGSSMFPQGDGVDPAGIGKMNGRMARHMLQAHGLPIVSESLFGIGHRKIVFDVSVGDVWANRGRLPAL
jgi:chemotaxis protein CheD